MSLRFKIQYSRLFEKLAPVNNKFVEVIRSRKKFAAVHHYTSQNIASTAFEDAEIVMLVCNSMQLDVKFGFARNEFIEQDRLLNN